jgi:hypothetical protein
MTFLVFGLVLFSRDCRARPRARPAAARGKRVSRSGGWLFCGFVEETPADAFSDSSKSPECARAACHASRLVLARAVFSPGWFSCVSVEGVMGMCVCECDV